MRTSEITQQLRKTYATDDLDRRAAVAVVTDTSLIYKIEPYVTKYADGWGIDWVNLADGIDSTPWSSSERALARLSCHLVGATPDTGLTHDWTLQRMLSGLDRTNSAAVLAALSLVLER